MFDTNFLSQVRLMQWRNNDDVKHSDDTTTHFS